MYTIAATVSEPKTDMRGMMLDSDLAINVLPAQGGPDISRLWPPATATSAARLTWSWPQIHM